MTLLAWALPHVGQIPERPGAAHHPFILWCHEATTLTATTDEVPWCSAYLCRGAEQVGLTRSTSAAARSWTTIGDAITLATARAGNDIVVFSRGDNPLQGHVGVFLGRVGDHVWVVGGNQANNVTIERFPVSRVVAVRRLRPV